MACIFNSCKIDLESPVDDTGSGHEALQQSALLVSDAKCSSLSHLSPEDAIVEYQKQKISEDLPKQRFIVCRVDDKGELCRDIIGIYKKPDLKLRAIPKVMFEEEDGVGSGPVRDFLVLSVRVADEGIPSTSVKSKPLLFFEGQQDHRLPVHDQSLRLPGTSKTLGRIIGHSILHGGPGLHGLSPAVKHVL